MEAEREKSGDFPIFKICSKIEAGFAELYHYYSELFSEDFDASALWKKVANEEENHLRQFEFADRIYRDADFKVLVDAGRSRMVCEKLGSLLEHVRQTPPTLETALEKAIEMEEVLADLHMTAAVEFADESIQKLFKAMAASDQEHIQSLRRYLTIQQLSHTEMNG
ncbi:MAG TPA: hypothetical protein VN642_17505 [Dongiaceae bacterium]|nr:hypothetical protein [Dongiaceae bacterium]